MRKLISFYCALILLISCGTNADGIVQNVRKVSGVDLVSNPDGTRGKTKSYTATLPFNHASYEKLELMKNAFDKTLGMLPTEKSEGHFTGDAIVDTYEWETTERTVSLKIKHKSTPEEIWLILFITEK